MYRIHVPNNTVTTLDPAQGGIPEQRNFFWLQLNAIIDATLKVMDGVAFVDFVEDIYKPVKQQWVSGSKVLELRDRDFEKLREICTKYDPKRFNTRWLTQDPAVDVVAFLNAFKTAVYDA